MAAVFDCESCGGKPDCNRQWKIGFCIKCDGKDSWCNECNGSGTIHVDRCPRTIDNDEAFVLLPYFFDWYNGGRTTYPDGRGSMFQPLKLKEAFYLYARYYDKKIRTKDGK